LLLQPRSALLHDWPAQHGAPSAPHATHELLLQATCGAVQRSPQQAWDIAPHPPQLLALQTPKPGQVAPASTHRPPKQQPPPLQVEGTQQGWPGPPHCAHRLPLQTAPFAQLVAVPVQHG
jgi:hypothetical protein